MSLMTPRGLKIRLELPWAFGLLGRLWEKDPRTDAFRVLKTCEAIEDVPAVLGFASAAAASYYSPWPIWSISVAYVLGTLAGILLTQLGLFGLIRAFGLVFISFVWSFIAGYGVLLLLGLIVTWFNRGWQGPLWWMVGLSGAFLIRMVTEACFQRRIYRLIGQPFTVAETNFFNAYRLHADRLGVTRDLEVTDAETESGLWRDCLLDYAKKYPEAVMRFPDRQELLDSMAALDR